MSRDEQIKANREAFAFMADFVDAIRKHDPEMKIAYAHIDGKTLGRDKYGPFPSPPERGQTA